MSWARTGLDFQRFKRSKHFRYAVDAKYTNEIGSEIGNEDIGFCRIYDYLMRVRSLLSTWNGPRAGEGEGEGLERRNGASGTDRVGCQRAACTVG
jgi:hypothetical protein